MLRRSLLIGPLLVLAGTAAPAEAAVDYQVTGKWTCRNGSAVAPVAGSRVELYRSRSYWPDARMRVAHTAGDGSFNFSVRADSNSTFYSGSRFAALRGWLPPPATPCCE